MRFTGHPSSENGFTRLEGVAVVIVVTLLVAIAWPAFTGTIHGGHTGYIVWGKEIARAVMAYAADHNGRFPEAQSNANEAYEQLFPDYVLSKRVFVPRRSAWTPNYPDEASLKRPGLAVGENGFAYVRGLNSESNPEFPLVAQGFREGSPGVYAFDPRRKGGVGSERRAVVIRVDGSGRVEEVNRWDFRVYKKVGFLRKMDIFAPAPGWLAADQMPLNPASE